MSNGRLFNYKEDILKDFQGNPSTLQKIRQKFSPKALAATIIIEFHNLTNKSINIEEYRKKYDLKYDKIICFKYSDLSLSPFYFTANAGQLFLLKDINKYHTMIVSDLNTILNILYGNITLQKARLDGKILLHGERIGHDEALFLEIFEAVSPKIKKKLQMDID